LTKRYKNIEALITDFDENLIAYMEDKFGIETDEIKTGVDFPVLKYKNRVFVHMSFRYSSYAFIIELKKSRKATITLMSFCWDHPADVEIIKMEEEE